MSQGQIFVSYDTREKEWASFVKDVIEARVPGVVTFVAYKDLKPGDPSIHKMLNVALRNARAIIPICSHLSRTSPWLWWEAASGWAREQPVYPLFLGISANEFQGPLTLVAQGRQFDVAGVNDMLVELCSWLDPSAKKRPLTKLERGRLEKLALQDARGPLQLDADGPSCFQGGDGYQLCRVRIANAGGTTVEGVEIMINAFAPSCPTFLPVRLQRMHSTIPGYPHPFALAPGAEAYVDVLQWLYEQDCFIFCYESATLPNVVDKWIYTIELTVSATNVRLTRERFVARLSEEMRLTLRKAEG